MKDEQCEVMNQNNLELHLPRDKEHTFMYLADAKWLSQKIWSKQVHMNFHIKFQFHLWTQIGQTENV